MVRYGSKRWNLLIILVIILVAGEAAFHIQEDYWSKKRQEITSGIMQGKGTMGERYDLWEGAVAAWWSSPISGVGMGQFASSPGKEVARMFRIPKEVGLVVHNSYLTVLAESGLVGLLLFLSWQIIALRRFYRILWQGHIIMNRYCAVSCFFALAVVMFMALTMVANMINYSGLWQALAWPWLRENIR